MVFPWYYTAPDRYALFGKRCRVSSLVIGE